MFKSLVVKYCLLIIILIKFCSCRRRSGSRSKILHWDPFKYQNGFYLTNIYLQAGSFCLNLFVHEIEKEMSMTRRRRNKTVGCNRKRLVGPSRTAMKNETGTTWHVTSYVCAFFFLLKTVEEIHHNLWKGQYTCLKGHTCWVDVKF